MDTENLAKVLERWLEPKNWWKPKTESKLLKWWKPKTGFSKLCWILGGAFCLMIVVGRIGMIFDPPPKWKELASWKDQCIYLGQHPNERDDWDSTRNMWRWCRDKAGEWDPRMTAAGAAGRCDRWYFERGQFLPPYRNPCPSMESIERITSYVE